MNEALHKSASNSSTNELREPQPKKIATIPNGTAHHRHWVIENIQSYIM